MKISRLVGMVLVLLLVPGVALAAVAFDTAGSSGFVSVGTSITIPLTVAATANRVLVVSVVDNSNIMVGTPTWNGVQTVTSTVSNPGGNVRASTFYLFNPDAGAHNLVVNFSGTANAEMGASFYNGVSQSGFDNTDVETVVSSAAFTFTSHITSTVANAMLVSHFLSTGAVNGVTSGTERWNNTDQSAGGDSGPQAVAGTYTLQASIGGGNRTTYAHSFSLAPAASAPATSPRKLIGTGISRH